MDDVTFRSDTVLSDVHLHASSKRKLMVRLNAVSQPGKRTEDVMNGWVGLATPPVCNTGATILEYVWGCFNGHISGEFFLKKNDLGAKDPRSAEVWDVSNPVGRESSNRLAF